MFYQYLKTMVGKTIILTLTSPEVWQQVATKSCFTQLYARTTSAHIDTPWVIKVTPLAVGYQELLEGGRTGLELLTHRDANDAKSAAILADAKAYNKVHEEFKSISEKLTALGF